jgi:hypothetical protein
MGHELLPIMSDVFNSKLFCDCFRAFWVPARDRDDLCSHAIAKARDLRGPGKPRPDDSNAYRRFLHGRI